jgi:hypothetical protein
MVRKVAPCAGFILYAIGWTRVEGSVALSSCPRPNDQYGPRYEVVTGAYQSRGISPGRGKFVTIMPAAGAAPVSVNVTDEVFNAAGSLKIDARIILVSYVTHSLSGSQPPYSCIELAR